MRVSSTGGIARPMRLSRMRATETPTSRPLASTTGPPELPGLMSPSICTTLVSPRSSSRMLETVPLPTVMAGLPFDVDRADPNGKPKM